MISKSPLRVHEHRCSLITFVARQPRKGNRRRFFFFFALYDDPVIKIGQRINRNSREEENFPPPFDSNRSIHTEFRAGLCAIHHSPRLDKPRERERERNKLFPPHRIHEAWAKINARTVLKEPRTCYRDGRNRR